MFGFISQYIMWYDMIVQDSWIKMNNVMLRWRGLSELWTTSVWTSFDVSIYKLMDDGSS